MEVKGKKWTGPPEVWALIGWVSGFATAANSVIGSPPNYFKAMTDIDILFSFLLFYASPSPRCPQKKPKPKSDVVKVTAVPFGK